MGSYEWKCYTCGKGGSPFDHKSPGDCISYLRDRIESLEDAIAKFIVAAEIKEGGE